MENSGIERGTPLREMMQEFRYKFVIKGFGDIGKFRITQP